VSKYQDHQNLLKRFKIAAQKEFPKIRFFDRHVGLFYTSYGEPVKINKPGMSDFYALYPSKYGLIHLEYEVKSGNSKQSKSQKNWQKFITENGGAYILIFDDYSLAIDQTKDALSLVL
jgi:hypothetical protein